MITALKKSHFGRGGALWGVSKHPLPSLNNVTDDNLKCLGLDYVRLFKVMLIVFQVTPVRPRLAICLSSWLLDFSRFYCRLIDSGYILALTSLDPVNGRRIFNVMWGVRFWSYIFIDCIAGNVVPHVLLNSRFGWSRKNHLHAIYQFYDTERWS